MTAQGLSKSVARASKANLRTTQYDTFDGTLARGIAAEIAAEKHIQWPNPKYETNPVQFVRDILGIELEREVTVSGDIEVEGRAFTDGETVKVDYQARILNDVVHHDRIAVTSGHKIGKSLIASCIALWAFCTFREVRIVMTSSTAAQVDRILWHEICRVKARSGRCTECKAKDPYGDTIETPCPHSGVIPESPAEKAFNGLSSDDKSRQIYGFSSREAENVAGISGPFLIFIVDEASGVPDVIFEAIQGNRAGGAKIILFSNPTRNAGVLYDAFHKNSKTWKLHRVSSMRTVNYLAGNKIIPGLATREWVVECEADWGVGSAMFKVRVLGMHALAEQGRPFDHHTIAEAQIRNDALPATGDLQIGLDPAGDGDRADDSGFAVRRGKKWLYVNDKLKTDLEGLAQEAKRLVLTYRRSSEPRLPVVTYDAEGKFGYRIGPILERIQVDEYGTKIFEVQPVRASDGATREPLVYERTSAELVANLEQFVKSGGGLPRYRGLEEELYAWEYFSTLRGTRKVDKNKVKKQIGRSPDRFDALALAAWTMVFEDAGPPAEAPPAKPQDRTAANATLEALRPNWSGDASLDDGYGEFDDESSDNAGIRPWG